MLDKIISDAKFYTDENVLLGMMTPDDAGVYKISDNEAIVQSVDFFTPVVDNPYDFGQIAAANSLSDIYAMGAVPKTALNIVCFPAHDMEISILKEVIAGGRDKAKEAETSIIGGHSIEDKELKYGLSVTGFVHPNKIITKGGFNKKDKIILTKPLGVGIINTAIKGDLADAKTIKNASFLMAHLNKYAAEIALKYKISAMTDVTGFGLLGHLSEMVVNRHSLSFEINYKKIPIIDEAVGFAKLGLIPAGTYRNKEFRKHIINFDSNVPREIEDILFDPQSSGGLVICVNENDAERLLEELQKKLPVEVNIIGEVVPKASNKIIVG